MDFSELIDIVNEYRGLGFQYLDDNTYLIGKVPHVAPRAWLHAIYPGLSENEILMLEMDLKISLPSSFKDFLFTMNGISLFSGTLDIFGFRKRKMGRAETDVHQPFDILTANISERLQDSSQEFLYFGFYNWDGSLVYFDSKEKVHLCSSNSSKSLRSWPNLESFLISEVKRINNLFDDKGREYNEMISTLPNLTD